MQKTDFRDLWVAPVLGVDKLNKDCQGSQEVSAGGRAVLGHGWTREACQLLRRSWSRCRRRGRGHIVNPPGMGKPAAEREVAALRDISALERPTTVPHVPGQNVQTDGSASLRLYSRSTLLGTGAALGCTATCSSRPLLRVVPHSPCRLLHCAFELGPICG